jgi:hypothetical protein
VAESHQGVGAIASIPADRVRNALNATMVLGLPANEADRPTFYFDRVVDWDNHDSENKPWDWTDVPTSEENPASVQPIVATEFFSPLGRQGAEYTEVGDFTPTTVVFTMMDDQFSSVFGSSYAQIGPSTKKWFFRFWRPAVALGSLQVYQVHFVAEGVD